MPVDGTKTGMAFRLVGCAEVESGQPEARDRSTGYYLAETLNALPGRPGLCIDLSVPALRRASRAHPRAAALAANIWQRLPLAAHSAAVVLSVFGPRNAAEIDRVLTADGALIIAAPGAGHLRELLRPLGMIGIDPGKPRRRERVQPLRYVRCRHGELSAEPGSRWPGRARGDGAQRPPHHAAGPRGPHPRPA
jgi:23S rRNA (guanine745-N1)-methyltransferase